MYKIITLALYSSNLIAGIRQAPPSFEVNGKKAVWVDFITARYELSFDLSQKSANSIATIEFEVIEAGYPIFDIVNTPTKIIVNDSLYEQQEINTPANESKVRILNKKLSPGRYIVEIHTPINDGVVFKDDSVSAGFFMKDMRDREFLEKYLPSNYEYDQYEMIISVNILNSSKDHQIFTNGMLIEKSSNYYKYRYPKYFTSTSLYFHLTPINKFETLKLKYRPKNNNFKTFPITIYSKSTVLNNRLKKKILKILNELENDYGA